MSLLNLSRRAIVAVTNLHLRLMRSSLAGYEQASAAAGYNARQAQKLAAYAADAARDAKREASQAKARYTAEAKELGRTLDA